MNAQNKINYLKEYHGRPLTLMEVCGSHTAAIARSGIRELLSPKIRLISGPGCPVCVTPSAYVDKLIELAKQPNVCVVTFGDLIRVPGSQASLSQAKGEGADVEMVYSPMDTLKLAKEHPRQQYVFAAVGFETTAPVYALLLEQMQKQNIANISLLTALKTMPNAIRWLLANGAKLDGFLAPGHVCAVTGSQVFEPLAEEFQIPFAVAGFEDVLLIEGIYGLVKMAEKREAAVRNFYPSVVTREGNLTAKGKLDSYFMEADAVWRGMGKIERSGLVLKPEFRKYDAGSLELSEDRKINPACCCGSILMGNMEPEDCPLFGTVCKPEHPQGACMVSYEGSCYQYYLNSTV